MNNMPFNPMGIANNMVGNNPLMQIINVVKGGGNPMSLLESMANNNPKIGIACKMVQGKNPQQLESMARNMCKESNIDINQIIGSLGMQMPNR